VVAPEHPAAMGAAGAASVAAMSIEDTEVGGIRTKASDMRVLGNHGSPRWRQAASWTRRRTPPAVGQGTTAASASPRSRFNDVQRTRQSRGVGRPCSRSQPSPSWSGWHVGDRVLSPTPRPTGRPPARPPRSRHTAKPRHDPPRQTAAPTCARTPRSSPATIAEYNAPGHKPRTNPGKAKLAIDGAPAHAVAADDIYCSTSPRSRRASA